MSAQKRKTDSKLPKKLEEIILFPSKLTPKGQKRRIGYQRKRKEATQFESQTEAETVEEKNEDRESESASVKDAENVNREKGLERSKEVRESVEDEDSDCESELNEWK